MFKVQRKLGYALISVKHMAEKGVCGLTTAKEIADYYAMPFDAVSRVLQNMKRAGFLESVQGAQGGYRIVKDLNEVSFLNLVEWVSGPMNITQCMKRKKSSCEFAEKCNIVEPIETLNGQVKGFYDSLSLKDLLELKTE